ncbi:hypothetical protein EVAR_44294_1 [Eumeta japonica]|uniref:Uncharacterized protein n=1 Tax=Eumeta variegata TaxID=151549 RepID=A0A4C1WQM8_EUMVA|nr:hypothetical protein EVAR_44294_1 [Eumeta japonica]
MLRLPSSAKYHDMITTRSKNLGNKYKSSNILYTPIVLERISLDFPGIPLSDLDLVTMGSYWEYNVSNKKTSNRSKDLKAAGPGWSRLPTITVAHATTSGTVA